MKHGSLFSGIGGFDLAAEWMGWENVFHCEWNPFGQKVLKHYWPNAISHNDITKTDFTIHRGTIDILTGGFPCQPYSSAGKRLGKEDERHLWPSMLRAIREIQPRWIVGENVLGLVNWNGGMVFEEVQADLEAEGYEVQPYVLPAAAVGAPHRRDRVWFVAYSNLRGRCREKGSWEYDLRGSQGKKQNNNSIKTDKRLEQWEDAKPITHPSSDGFNDKSSTTNNIIGQDNIESGTQRERTIEGFGNERAAADTSCRGVSGYGRESQRKQIQTAEFNKDNSKQFRRMDWEKFPTQSPICNGDDGISDRLDGITFPKWRNESIKAGGNAIVPQVVLQIFKAIEQYGIQNTSKH